MSVLLLASLVGCFKVTRRPSCEEVSRTELADDEQTELGTVQEILDQVLLDAEVPATWWDGEAVDADLRIERAGAGSWVELQSIEIETRGLGFGGVELEIYVDCSPSIFVPVELALQAGEVDLELQGRVQQNYSTEYDSTVRAEGDYSSEHFPWVDRDPQDYVDKQSSVTLGFEGGQITQGHAGWGGVLDTEDRNQAGFETVLEIGGQE